MFHSNGWEESQPKPFFSLPEEQVYIHSMSVGVKVDEGWSTIRIRRGSNDASC